MLSHSQCLKCFKLFSFEVSWFSECWKIPVFFLHFSLFPRTSLREGRCLQCLGSLAACRSSAMQFQNRHKKTRQNSKVKDKWSWVTKTTKHKGIRSNSNLLEEMPEVDIAKMQMMRVRCNGTTSVSVCLAFELVQLRDFEYFETLADFSLTLRKWDLVGTALYFHSLWRVL